MAGINRAGSRAQLQKATAEDADILAQLIATSARAPSPAQLSADSAHSADGRVTDDVRGEGSFRPDSQQLPKITTEESSDVENHAGTGPEATVNLMLACDELLADLGDDNNINTSKSGNNNAPNAK